MTLLVHKYGGSSVATPEKITAIAEKLLAARAEGADLVVVVSAMGKSTNQLLDLAGGVTEAPNGRELDVLLTAGERVTTALLAMALEQRGCPAVSLTGEQAGIRTTPVHNAARITDIDTARMRSELDAGRVVVVAGFQGYCQAHETTTLGRGGSDTTAVALAAALHADRCDIFSDVDGVYSADPRVVPGARRIDSLGYEEMQELARQGAKVLNADAVEFAKRGGVQVFARSTFGGPASTSIQAYETGQEKPRAAGVAGRSDLMRLRYRSVGTAQVLDALQSLSPVSLMHSDSEVDALLSTENISGKAALEARIGASLAHSLEVEESLGSVAAVGLGLGTNPQAMARARQLLTDANVPVLGTFETPQAVTCVVPPELVSSGMLAVHQGFIETPFDFGGVAA